MSPYPPTDKGDNYDNKGGGLRDKRGEGGCLKALLLLPRTMTTKGGISPCPRRRCDGDGRGDDAVPSNRQRRQLHNDESGGRRDERVGRMMKTSNKSGRWMKQGKRVENDDGKMDSGGGKLR